MPVDYYPQKSVEELLGILDSLQKRASTGVVFFTTAAGIQNQRSFQNGNKVEVEIRRVLYSLHLRGAEGDEENPYPDPYLQRVRRTRAHYL
jgi:hypothetical protein